MIRSVFSGLAWRTLAPLLAIQLLGTSSQLCAQAPAPTAPVMPPSAADPVARPANIEAAAAPVPAPMSAQVNANPLDSTRPTSPTDISGAPGQGLTVKVGDAFSLNIRTRMLVRYQLNIPQPDADGERNVEQIVNINTARIYFSGNVFTPKLTYLFQLAVAGRDYRDGTISPIYDAYMDWKAHRDFNVQVGQFFVPFDRLRTVREWALQLGDRPRPVQEFTLDRDAGVVIYADKFLSDASPVALRLGAFGGGGINLTNGRPPGALLVGRIELRPFGPIDDDREGDVERHQNPVLALGTAVATTINANRTRANNGPTYKSPTITPYTGGTVDYTHFAADLVFKWQGFALQVEYLLRRADHDLVRSTDAMGNPVTEYSRSGYGWITQASYVFSVPFEVVGRFTRMYAISGTDPNLVSDVKNRGVEIAGGVNYYFNGHRFKLQADWIGRMTPDFTRPDHTIHAQLDATF